MTGKKPPDTSSGRVGLDDPSTVMTYDPIGSDISCRFDWGDGQKSDWTEPTPGDTPHTLAHIRNKPGRYEVRAQAKNTQGVQSDWGPALVVTTEENSECSGKNGGGHGA